MGGKREREGGTRNAAAAGCYIVLLTAAAFPFIRLAATRHLLPPGQIAPGGGFIFLSIMRMNGSKKPLADRKRFWWSICDHIRKICSRRILIERVFEVDIGDLFASLDVIKNDYAVVVEIDAVNKCVDDIAAEFWIEKVSGAEFFKPRPNFAFGQANITCNTQLDQIAFGGFCAQPLAHQSAHPPVYSARGQAGVSVFRIHLFCCPKTHCHIERRWL